MKYASIIIPPMPTRNANTQHQRCPGRLPEPDGSYYEVPECELGQCGKSWGKYAPGVWIAEVWEGYEWEDCCTCEEMYHYSCPGSFEQPATYPVNYCNQCACGLIHRGGRGRDGRILGWKPAKWEPTSRQEFAEAMTMRLLIQESGEFGTILQDYMRKKFPNQEVPASLDTPENVLSVSSENPEVPSDPMEIEESVEVPAVQFGYSGTRYRFHYQGPALEWEARETLATLYHGRSMKDYLVQFKEAMTWAGYPEEKLIQCFYDHLAPEAQDWLEDSVGTITTIEGLFAVAEEWDLGSWWPEDGLPRISKIKAAPNPDPCTHCGDITHKSNICMYQYCIDTPDDEQHPGENVHAAESSADACSHCGDVSHKSNVCMYQYCLVIPDDGQHTEENIPAAESSADACSRCGDMSHKSNVCMYEYCTPQEPEPMHYNADDRADAMAIIDARIDLLKKRINEILEELTERFGELGPELEAFRDA